MTRIGRNQLRILMISASPTCVLLTTDRASDSLVRRGLMRNDGCKAGKAACITPAGLRALADEMEAGRVDDAIAVMCKERDERQRKKAART